MQFIYSFGNGEAGFIKGFLLNQKTEPTPFIIWGNTIYSTDGTFIRDGGFPTFFV